MKILYVAMKYDYGQSERGYSFEHHNFFEALRAAGHELVYFDFMTLLDELGRDGMNRRLLELARSEEPQLMFTALFKDELDQRVVREISTKLPTTTLNWFCDDHWRFESFSARWAPCFDWVVTTATSALPKYERLGYRNVIKSQWACNHHLYRKLDLPLIHDVSFVGQPHGNRVAVIETLRRAGIDVYTRGYGWPEGRVSQEEMIRIFNQSRINLNLPNASQPVLPDPSSRSHTVRRSAGRLIRTVPYGARAIEVARRATRPRAPGAGNSRSVTDVNYPEQIKGRNFEVPGSGGFLLTGPADDLEEFYAPGREIVVFHGPDDLIGNVRRYLADEDERQAIAAAGYERTLRDHTYDRRFEEIFETIGLTRMQPR